MKDAEEISKKLDVLIRLIATTVGADLPTSERAPLLSRAGLDRNSIAAVCGTTPEAVSVRLAEAKKGSRRKR
jgi:hypothetical protein